MILIECQRDSVVTFHETKFLLPKPKHHFGLKINEHKNFFSFYPFTEIKHARTGGEELTWHKSLTERIFQLLLSFWYSIPGR